MHTPRVLNRNASDGLFATEPIPTALEEKQKLLAHLVRLVARKLSNGLFIFGQGGLGKSHTIMTVFGEEGINPVVLNSHVTPLALYATLYQHRKDAVIWLDDADAIFGNLVTLGLLRSALWGQPERILTYTSTQVSALPNRFVFESRVIFCANAVPKKNEAFRAMLSRIDTFEMNATNEEILEQMQVWANHGHGDLSATQCVEVVQFIAEAGGTRRLSLRLYEPSLRKVEYALHAGADWRELVRCQLDQVGQSESIAQALDSKAQDMKIMNQAIFAHPFSAQEQEAFWRRATGKSRASFFRCKREAEKKGA